MADADRAAPKDRHPELSAPIVDLSLEAQIARAEQAVVDRDARVRGDARRIGDTLRSKRGAAIRWAAIAGAGAAAGAGGYAGYKAWRGRRPEPAAGPKKPEPSTATSFASEFAAIAQVVTQWALRLHREQGVFGSVFGMVRSVLWPGAGGTPTSIPSDSPAAPARGTRDIDGDA